MMEGKAPASPAAMLAMISRSGKACIISTLLSIALIILSPVILIALRWDNLVTWPWAVSFIPLWIFQAFLFLPLALIRPPPPPEEQDEYTRILYEADRQRGRLTQVSGLTINTLVVLFEILLALRLEDAVDFPWLVV